MGGHMNDYKQGEHSSPPLPLFPYLSFLVSLSLSLLCVLRVCVFYRHVKAIT